MILYLVIIAVCMVIVVMLNWLALGWTFLGALYWVSVTTGIEFGIMVVLAILTGLCLPHIFYHECKLYAVGPREIKFYRAIGLPAWKDRVIELGALGGFSKKKLVAPNDSGYIDRFIYELNKGMFMHAVAVVGAFLIMAVPVPGLWSIRLPVALVGAFLNILPLMVLRYNKPRLLLVKKRLARQQEEQ